jgi:hypothetical protein
MKAFKRQVLFFLGDISGHLFQFLSGLIQISLAVLVLFYVVHLSFVSFDTINKMNVFTSMGEVYQIRPIAEAGQIDSVINDKQKMENFKMLLDQVEQIESAEMIEVSNSLGTYLKDTDIPYRKLGSAYAGEIMINTVRVSPNFFGIFKIGESLDTRELARTFASYGAGEKIPAITGYGFHDYLQAGDTFFDSEEREYIVAGVLKKDESYVAPYESPKAYNLNNCFLVPSVTEQAEGIGAFAILINKYFITEDRSVMDGIIEKANAYGLMPLEYGSLSSQVEVSTKELRNEILTMLTIAALVFLFASIGMVAYFVRLIHSRIREFGIHMIVGARKREIYLRVALQMISICIIPQIAIAVIFGFSLDAAITFLISAVYAILVLLYPIILLKNLSLIGILRGEAN